MGFVNKGSAPAACNMNINPESLAAMCKGVAQSVADAVPGVGLQG